MQSSLSTKKPIRIRIEIWGLKTTASSDAWFYYLALYSLARFFFGFVRILSGNPYYKIISGVIERQRIKTFYTFILFTCMVFLKVSNCILMILLISALFYVNIRVICHEYIHWLMTEDTHWEWKSLNQMLRYITFIINYCCLWDIEN